MTSSLFNSFPNNVCYASIVVIWQTCWSVQEFPQGFVHPYEKLYSNLTFANLHRATCNTQWPMVVTKRNTGKTERVVAYGADGWARFVEENGINTGDLLVFLHLGHADFMVYVFPKCAQCPWCVRGVDRNPSSQWSSREAVAFGERALRPFFGAVWWQQRSSEICKLGSRHQISGFVSS